MQIKRELLIVALLMTGCAGRALDLPESGADLGDATPATADLGASATDLAFAGGLATDLGPPCPNGICGFVVTQTERRLSAPTGVVTGDFDGDGNADFVVANYRADYLSFYRGRGNGRFDAPTAIPCDLSPFELVARDFDGDGVLDLAMLVDRQNTRELVGDHVALLRGAGDGTFSAWAGLDATGMTLYYLAAGDLDGDGRADLIATGAANGLVTWRGNGDGSFASALLSPVPEQGVLWHLALGDLDGDGVLDVLVSDFSVPGRLWIYRGRGDGTLAAPLGTDAMGRPSWVALSGRRCPRIVTATYQEVYELAGVEVIDNDCAGNFSLESTLSDAQLAMGELLLLDVDRDGVDDVVQLWSGGVQILRGAAGSDQLGAPGRIATDPPFELASADFDGDGNPDLVVTSLDSETVTVLLGGGGTFKPAYHDVGGFIAALAASDVDGDGKLDLISANYSSRSLSIFFGRGDDTLTLPVDVTLSASPLSVTAADLDGDGHAELVAQGALVKYAGHRRLGPVTSLAAATGQINVIADANHDGRLDLFSFGPGASLALGNGDGTFAAPVALGPDNVETGLVGDLDGDAIPDLIVLDLGVGGLVRLFHGNGDGTFAPTGTMTLPGYTGVANALADLDGDGVLDFVITRWPSDESPSSLYTMRGNGDGTFAPPVLVANDGWFTALAALDFDGDGHVDLALTDSGSGTYDLRINGSLVFLRGNGDGSFAALRRFPVAWRPQTLAAGDFDGDGRPDIALGHWATSSITIFKNQF